MNKFRSSLLSIGLSLATLASPMLSLVADDCNNCNTDCSVSCNTNNSCSSGCNSCGRSDCNGGCGSSCFNNGFNGCNSCGNSNCSGCGNNSCGDFCSTSTICGSCGPCATVLLGRSTHDNTAYRWLPFAFLPDTCDFNGGFALGFEFQQTFKDRDLARCLFGGRNTLVFQGSQVASRTPGALIADNFGLSQTFSGSISFCPQIRNYNLHFESYWGFDNWAEGLFLRADMTFTHQERRLFADNGCNNCSNVCSSTLTTSTANSAPFAAGQMGCGVVPVATADILAALGGTLTFGDMQTLPRFGRFSSCKLDDNKVAGFSLDLGYNFWLCDDSQFGIYLRYSAPTGTKLNGSQKNASFFFSPIIGNGHYNELGGGIIARKELWCNDCGDSISFYLDGYATHLFDTCQIRSFDFLGKGCMSRYMLLKELVPTSAAACSGAIAGSTIAATAQGFAFDGNLIPGINFATRNVRSCISVQGDASLRFIYQHNNLAVSLGYNAFGRAREDVCLRAGSPCNVITSTASYGFKGCAPDRVFCYAVTGSAITGVGTITGDCSTSNVTQSNATICACGTDDNSISTLFCINTVGGATGTVCLNTPTITGGTNVTALPAGVVITDVSAPAETITADATTLDIQGGRIPRLFTNKGFVTIDYVWDRCEWSPYVGIGGEVEGGSRCCDIKQWGVWLKGGFSF